MTNIFGIMPDFMPACERNDPRSARNTKTRLFTPHKGRAP